LVVAFQELVELAGDDVLEAPLDLAGFLPWVARRWA
jgi:hypothetical protein